MRGMTDDTEREQLRSALVAYAEAHPDASDTIEGIRIFWLASQVGCSAKNLEWVLREFVASRMFIVTPLPDGTSLYSVRKRST
jgi:hypothetical protein